MHYTVQPNQ